MQKPKRPISRSLGTTEPNVGGITVPDERLTKLAELVHPGRIVPTTVEKEQISPDW